MKILFSGRHKNITRAMRAYVEEKVPHLEHYFDREITAQVVMDGGPGRFRVEIVLHANRRKVMVAEVEKPKWMEAVEAAIEKAEHQLRKYKEKLKARR